MSETTAEMVAWADKLAKVMKDAPGFGSLLWSGYGGRLTVSREVGAPIQVQFNQPKPEGAEAIPKGTLRSST